MECALWYLSHGFARYSLCDDEAAAVAEASWISDGDDGAVMGVQRADGTYTPIEEWAEYEAEQMRLTRLAVEKVAREMAQPRPALRTIHPPFDAPAVDVPADAPSWLGQQFASRSGR